jgi:epoxide hydrolase 4
MGARGHAAPRPARVRTPTGTVNLNGDEMEHRVADAGEVRLHYVEAGTGPLVLLLHGFPEFWYSWRHQIPALAAAGFRVVAPDLRGCNRSEKPPGVAAYRMERLVGDVAGLIAACGAQRASLVGHDWGGAVAWAVAARRPEAVERLAVLNAPHPSRFLAVARRRPRQLARSWYMAFFQLPWLPERVTRARGYAGLRRSLARAANPGTFTTDDLDRYVEAFRQPGAVSGGINYYRAMGRSLRPARSAAARRSRVQAPVLVIWGERDRFLLPELADPGRHAPNARVVRLPDAGHFVHQDAPEAVNHLLVDYLRGAPGRS